GNRCHKPARRARSARRRWGPDSSHARSCAARLVLGFVLGFVLGVVLGVVPGFVLVWRVLTGGAPAKSGEFAEARATLGDPGALEEEVDDPLLEDCRLDAAHRLRVTQVRAPRLLGVGVALR